MSLTATQLRAQVYRILDEVLETGTPAVIERKGQRLLIIRERSGSVFDRLVRRNAVNGDPEALVEMDWSGEWSPELPEP